MQKVRIFSSYYGVKDEKNFVIAIAKGAFYIYNGIFEKPNTARQLASKVSSAGAINVSNWIKNDS